MFLYFPLFFVVAFSRWAAGCCRQQVQLVRATGVYVCVCVFSSVCFNKVGGSCKNAGPIMSS